MSRKDKKNHILEKLKLDGLSLEQIPLNKVEQLIDSLNLHHKNLLSNEKIKSDECAFLKETEKNKAFQQKNIVVVGGAGLLGRRFVKLFKSAGHQTQVIEKGDWPNSKRYFSSADLVLLALPIDLTIPVIEQLSELPENCVLADITSIKKAPLTAMLKAHSGPVVGLHPMFGPDVESFKAQTIVVCEGRQSEAYQWLLNLLNEKQVNLFDTTAEEHDKTMAFVQVLRHFSTIAYGVHLAKEAIPLESILTMSSPIYRLELAMVGRLFAQDPSLYTEIIYSNPDNVLMMERFAERFNELLTLVKANDKQSFKQAFDKTKNWFGDYASQFLIESGEMLAATKNVNRKV